MSKAIYMPKYRPGDFVGFNSGNNFVIGKIEYCQLIGKVWYYNIAGWTSYMVEAQLHHFPHITPGLRFEIKDE